MPRITPSISALCVALLLLAASAARGETIDALAGRPDAWPASDEGRRVLDNVVSWQQPSGGWWKAYDVRTAPPDDAAPAHDGRSTFDNDATWSELRLLARAVTLVGDARHRAAFDRGLRATLDSQYANGGFPQRFPPPPDYGRHVTFNDDAMTNVLRLLRDVAAGESPFAFVDHAVREEAADAFDRGIACILSAQVVIDGKPTVWCAQHDADTLAPAAARSYELPSLSGGESADVVLLLMSIDEPSDAVKDAVVAAIDWYERAKLTGVRLERFDDADAPRGFDVRLVADADAPPLWGRFYDLDTGRVFFADRDGVKVDSLDQIGVERRTGYAWLRPFGAKLLAAYPVWAERHGIDG